MQTGRTLSIDGKDYGSRNPLVIAELGTGSGADACKGIELIHAAVEAGADCVKFQHVYADEIIHPNTGLVPLPGGPVSLYSRFEALSTGPDFLARMKDEVESRGALFLCTPFGLRSARELRNIGARAMKLASPELNHLPLIAEMAGYRLPAIVSSGVSTLADIESALRLFRDSAPDAYGPASGGLALLHCVTAYPAPETDYNLRVLAALSAIFGVAVGVSDHSLDPILVPALATVAGASVIEKHFCLSRSDPGLDDPIALPPAEFRRMKDAVSAAAADPEGGLAELKGRYGAETIEKVLGSGRKELAPSERANYSRTNRSIHAVRAIAEGEILGADTLALLRTEKVLRPGLPPAMLPMVLGRRARRAIPSGEGVTWEDLGA